MADTGPCPFKRQCPFRTTCGGHVGFCVWLVWAAMITGVGVVSFIFWSSGMF